MDNFYIALICIGFSIMGYLLGSVLCSEWLGRLANKNIRETGSKSPGATNLSRSTSKAYGILGMLLDASKGYIAVILALIIYRYSIYKINSNVNLYALIYIAGTFAVIGHCYPLLYVITLFKNKFNFELAKTKSGGKGVSTAGGVLLSVSPWIGLLAFGVWLTLLLIFRYVCVSSIVCMVIAPFFVFVHVFQLFYLFDNSWFGNGVNNNTTLEWVLFALLYFNSLLIVYRHKSNLVRLKNKQESKFF